MEVFRTLPRAKWAIARVRGVGNQLLNISRSGSTKSRPAFTTPLRAVVCEHNHGEAQGQLPQKRFASSFKPIGPLKKTALYDLHVAHGAKMVPFGGFDMPVQYNSLTVTASHHFTRSHASLFDVGHMVQHMFSGQNAASFLQRITPASLTTLPVHQSTLSTLLWPGTGGIVDDAIITKLNEELFFVVTNAACRDKDLDYLSAQLQEWNTERRDDVGHEVLDHFGLVALQGPLAENILSELLSPSSMGMLGQLYFGQSRFMFFKVEGKEAPVRALITRGGYTGEDGFEISSQNENIVAITKTLLSTAGNTRLQLAGLGARDSLRLEAGMCLYGHDLDDTTTPVEAALSWVIGEDRRDPRAAGAFHGADVILSQLTPKSKGGGGVERRRVGLTVEGAPAREGAEILDKDGQKIGVITSGCPSPTLQRNIAMGYIKNGQHKAGIEVEVLVRGKARNAVLTKMPFVPTKYRKAATDK